MAPKSVDATFLKITFVIFLATAVAGLSHSSPLGIMDFIIGNGDRGGDGAGNAENLKGSLGSGFYSRVFNISMDYQ